MRDLLKMVLTAEKKRTSIPKEIKYLKQHYVNLVEDEKNTKNLLKKKNLSDLLSFICIPLEENYDRNSLRYFS